MKKVLPLPALSFTDFNTVGYYSGGLTYKQALHLIPLDHKELHEVGYNYCCLKRGKNRGGVTLQGHKSSQWQSGEGSLHQITSSRSSVTFSLLAETMEMLEHPCLHSFLGVTLEGALPSRTPCPPGWLPSCHLCVVALRQDPHPAWVWRWAPEKSPVAQCWWGSSPFCVPLGSLLEITAMNSVSKREELLPSPGVLWTVLLTPSFIPPCQPSAQAADPAGIGDPVPPTSATGAPGCG